MNVYFISVIQALAVCIGQQRIGTVNIYLIAVIQAVAVGVAERGVSPVGVDLVRVGYSVAVNVDDAITNVARGKRLVDGHGIEVGEITAVH